MDQDARGLRRCLPSHKPPPNPLTHPPTFPTSILPHPRDPLDGADEPSGGAATGETVVGRTSDGWVSKATSEPAASRLSRERFAAGNAVRRRGSPHPSRTTPGFAVGAHPPVANNTRVRRRGSPIAAVARRSEHPAGSHRVRNPSPPQAKLNVGTVDRRIRANPAPPPTWRSLLSLRSASLTLPASRNPTAVNAQRLPDSGCPAGTEVEDHHVLPGEPAARRSCGGSRGHPAPECSAPRFALHSGHREGHHPRDGVPAPRRRTPFPQGETNT